MTHNRHDIGPIHIGQDAELPLQIRDEDGNTVDMTSGEATLTVFPLSQRNHATDQVDSKVQKSITGGGIVTDASTLVNNINVDPSVGDLAVVFEPSDTDSFDPQTFWYRVDVVDGQGQTVPAAAAGEFTLTRG